MGWRRREVLQKRPGVGRRKVLRGDPGVRWRKEKPGVI